MLTLLSAAALAAARGLQAMYEMQGRYLRSWVSLWTAVNNRLLLPAFIFGSVAFFLLFREQRSVNGRKLWNRLLAVAAVLYGIGMLAGLGSLYKTALDMGRNREYVGIDGWMVQTDMTTGQGTYYEDYTWLWKKEYFATADSVTYDMEQKYGTKFVPAKESVSQTGWGVYTLVSKEWPELIFHVQPGADRSFMEDYVQVRANLLMIKTLKEKYPDRQWHVQMSDTGTGDTKFVNGFVLECEGLADAESCAVQALSLADILLSDVQAAKYGADIIVHCQGVEEMLASIPFTVGGNEERDKYIDWSLIYARLLENYTWNYEDGQEGEAGNEIDLEASTFYTEGAYKALYDALFAAAGYPYKPSYNAKGNFYAYLTEGTGTLESVEEVMNTMETVVYDRVSENGKCHLFVHYREYYQVGETMPYTTEIVDMYAVDMATGQVYTSGRHAWADLGSEEYRKATGEP